MPQPDLAQRPQSGRFEAADVRLFPSQFAKMAEMERFPRCVRSPLMVIGKKIMPM
jgi:hypothetical protein